MFVVWGTKVRRKVMGYCADFCPTCRDIRVCKVTEIHGVPHLYWIPTGPGSYEGVERACTVCRTPMAHDPSVSLRDKPTDTEAMVADVPPATLISWLETIREEERAATSSVQLTPPQRIERMVGVFAKFEALARSELLGQVRVTWRGMEWFLMWLAVLILLVVCGPFLARLDIVKWMCESTGTDVSGLGAFFMACLAGAMAVYGSETRVPSFFKRDVFPMLVPRLYPLRPRPEELGELKEALEHGGYEVARFPIPARIKALEAHAIKKRR